VLHLRSKTESLILSPYIVRIIPAQNTHEHCVMQSFLWKAVDLGLCCKHVIEKVKRAIVQINSEVKTRNRLE
jgi:hypothetical protein